MENTAAKGAPARWIAERRFFTGMVIAMLLVAYVGFARSFFLRPLFPEWPSPSEPIFYVHGVFFSAWSVLLVIQAMLVGVGLVIIDFNVALPISQLSSTVSRGTLGIALATVMLAFLMMITRTKAIPQVIGFLAMENALFFAATSATYGMPMVVELGIALDVLVGMLILGVFFFQIREQFDSLDLKHLEKLKEGE